MMRPLRLVPCGIAARVAVVARVPVVVRRWVGGVRWMARGPPTISGALDQLWKAAAAHVPDSKTIAAIVATAGAAPQLAPHVKKVQDAFIQAAQAAIGAHGTKPQFPTTPQTLLFQPQSAAGLIPPPPSASDLPTPLVSMAAAQKTSVVSVAAAGAGTQADAAWALRAGVRLAGTQGMDLRTALSTLKSAYSASNDSSATVDSLVRVERAVEQLYRSIGIDADKDPTPNK